MKQCLALLIAAIMLFVLTACGENAQPTDTTTTTVGTTEVPVDYTAFVARYSDTDTVDGPCYTVNITAADTASKTVEFVVSYVGPNSSPVYNTETISATVADDHTVAFEWADSWSNKGEGTLVLNPADTSSIQVMMTVTEEADVNRATLSTNGEYRTLTRR